MKYQLLPHLPLLSRHILKSRNNPLLLNEYNSEYYPRPSFLINRIQYYEVWSTCCLTERLPFAMAESCRPPESAGKIPGKCHGILTHTDSTKSLQVKFVLTVRTSIQFFSIKCIHWLHFSARDWSIQSYAILQSRL